MPATYERGQESEARHIIELKKEPTATTLVKTDVVLNRLLLARYTNLLACLSTVIRKAAFRSRWRFTQKPQIAKTQREGDYRVHSSK